MCSMLCSLEYATHSSTLCLQLVLCPAVATYAVGCMLEASWHPYDVLECEPEVVCGWYVDYGGVSFMLVYLAEGIAMGARHQ